MIQLKNIEKIYHTGKIEYTALKNINLEILAGEFISIMGPSGSGKSTLLNILGCLDVPTHGHYLLNDKDVARLSPVQLARIRNSTFGFIFQNFNLLPYLNAYENIELPLIYSNSIYSKTNIISALEIVNLSRWAKHKPTELSGGQQQRVAIARALVNNPAVIFADEPTGNLDSRSGKDIMDLLINLNKQGITVINVTHDDEVASFSKRVIHIRDGEVFSDKKRVRHTVIKNKLIISEKIFSLLSLKKIKQNIIISLKSIITKKMRTLLTTLGILIGVASVISMISIGEGAKKNITNTIKSMGSNLLFIHSGGGRRGMHGGGGAVAEGKRLTEQDLSMLVRQASTIKAITPVVNSSVNIKFQNRNMMTSIQGVNSSFPEINNYKISQGIFFDEKAVRLKERTAVIGQTIVKDLFQGQDPIGQYVKLNRINFLIIGTFESKGATTWQDADNVIAIPVSTAQKRLVGIDYYSGINIKVKTEELMPAAEEEITRILRLSHNIKPEDEPDFHVMSQMEIMQNVQETTRTFTLLLAGIASISLLVGGIGIMNIMLVTIMERIKEIGVRKAVGAQRSDILFQFLTESIIICFIGGLLGILLGLAVSRIISGFSQWGTSIPLYAVFIAFLFSFIVGVFFGIYPAFKAARLNPIDALRYE